MHNNGLNVNATLPDYEEQQSLDERKKNILITIDVKCQIIVGVK